MAMYPAMTPTQIKKLRESLGHSQDEFAYALGYRHKQKASNISRWETGIATPPPPAILLMKQLAENSNKITR
jgi:DNA-binding transcriptional regulator YiaG